MKFFAWLVMFSLAAGVSLGVVAGDAEDCKNYYLAKDYERAFPACAVARQSKEMQTHNLWLRV